jgi:hypothetical protein
MFDTRVRCYKIFHNDNLPPLYGNYYSNIVLYAMAVKSFITFAQVSKLTQTLYFTLMKRCIKLVFFFGKTLA